MFSQKNRTKSILISGPSDSTRPFIFEVNETNKQQRKKKTKQIYLPLLSIVFQSAINWAEEGHRVLYIAPAQLTEIPAKYHDRENPTSTTYSLIRFM